MHLCFDPPWFPGIQCYSSRYPISLLIWCTCFVWSKVDSFLCVRVLCFLVPQTTRAIGSSFLGRNMPVYRSYLICVNDRDSLVDLMVLDIVDFDVILGMDWLASYYITMNCHQKTIKFEVLDEPTEQPLPFQDDSNLTPTSLVSYLIAMHLLEGLPWFLAVARKGGCKSIDAWIGSHGKWIPRCVPQMNSRECLQT